jgi:glycosyltransferase 2 family protein
VVYFVRTQVWRTVDLRDPRLCAVLLGSSLAYALGGAVISYGWVRWLKSAGDNSVSTVVGIVLYCRSQLAKYIPGNVFHLVARQTQGSGLGASHSALALASASESAALVMTACALAALGDASGFPHVPRAAAFTLACLCIAGAIPLTRFLQRNGPSRSFRAQLLDTLLTLTCYFPFFVWNGLSLAVLLFMNHDVGPRSIVGLTGIWSLSWLAGYVTPGASGGLGIREAALVYGLSTQCSRPEAVAIAMEMRLVSTLGDVTLWLAATAFRHAVRIPAHRAA